MPDRQSAIDYPRGDLELCVCTQCGFMANAAFDAALLEYSPNYEETQGFSPTFSRFARSLAEQLVNELGLAGKTVIEIGCGKGEFLLALAEAGIGRGIGFDPAYVPGRLSGPAMERLEFVQDLYSEKYAGRAADCIVCRHTLEHIGPTLEFLRGIRAAVGQRDTKVFFEVPDMKRILDEGAFWDVYYEHCSYFTAGSLARLFRRAGFLVRRLTRAFDDQYLHIVAEPAHGSLSSPAEVIEESADNLTRWSLDFAAKTSGQMSRWRDYIGQRHAEGQRTVLWGSGSKAVAFLTSLELDGQIEFVVDINPHRHDRYMPGTGQRIVGPGFLTDYGPDLVIAMNPAYIREIADELLSLGVRAELLAV